MDTKIILCHELYELYIENKAKEIYNLILDKGKNIKYCGGHGYHENGKWFSHWGHDISPEENQYEAGLTYNQL